jgi:hypothetical protein
MKVLIALNITRSRGTGSKREQNVFWIVPIDRYQVAPNVIPISVIVKTSLDKCFHLLDFGMELIN